MGRREVYCVDDRLQIYFTRWELEDRSVEVEEKQTATSYRHRDYPTRCVRWTGLHLTQYGDQPVKRAQGSQICDAGPRLGISVAVELAPEVPYTPEERAAGREKIRQAIERIYGCRCYWNGEGGGPDVVKTKKAPPAAYMNRV